MISTLDTFTRANGAPGANWALAASTYNVPNIVSNELDWPQFPALYWTPQQFAANQGVQIETRGTAEGVYMLLRWTAPGAGAERGYLVSASYGGLQAAEAFVWTAGQASETSLGFANGILAPTDRWYRSTIEGSLISLYGGTNGTVWNLRQTWNDSTIGGAGYIGLFHPNNSTPGTVDNFGGGNLSDDFVRQTQIATSRGVGW